MKKIIKFELKKDWNVQFISHLWGSKAEGSGVDVSLVSINQVQAFVLGKTQVPPGGHVAESEWLAPACMTATPAEEYEKKFDFRLLK